MGKRKLPKNYFKDSIESIVNAINNLNKRLNTVELLLSEYIKWMKHEKKFNTHLEKKLKNKDTVQNKEK